MRDARTLREWAMGRDNADKLFVRACECGDCAECDRRRRMQAEREYLRPKREDWDVDYTPPPEKREES